MREHNRLALEPEPLGNPSNRKRSRAFVVVVDEQEGLGACCTKLLDRTGDEVYFHIVRRDRAYLDRQDGGITTRRWRELEKGLAARIDVIEERRTPQEFPPQQRR